MLRNIHSTCHYRVTKLRRVRIMNIELGDLRPGAYRNVSRKEYAALREALKHSRG